VKKLEEHIRKRGFDLDLVRREGMVAIYSQSDEGVIRAYEVIEIKERKESEFMGRTIEAHEKYPADSEWGRTGWSFGVFSHHPKRALAKANAQMDLVLNRIKERV